MEIVEAEEQIARRTISVCVTNEELSLHFAPLILFGIQETPRVLNLEIRITSVGSVCPITGSSCGCVEGPCHRRRHPPGYVGSYSESVVDCVLLKTAGPLGTNVEILVEVFNQI